MINFFCAICMDDKYLHPKFLDKNDAKADCDTCGSELSTSWTRPEKSNESDLTLEKYNEIHGLTE